MEYHKFSGVKLASFANLVEEIVKHKLLTEKGASSEHLWVRQYAHNRSYEEGGLFLLHTTTWICFSWM